MNAKQILESGKVLTLAVAKKLIGHTLYVTNREDPHNEPRIRKIIVSLQIEWDWAANDHTAEGFDNRQEYWKSFMKQEMVEELQNTYVLLNVHGNITARCNINNTFFDEPTFHGSDADREIYYIEEKL
jgi:hypothetical protein